MEIAIVKNNMIYKEARECADKINANMNNVRHLVLDLYEREGWTALGYESWRECVTKEFNSSQSHIYRQLDAAKTELNISPIGENQSENNICTIVQKDPIPESQLRPLTRLEPDQQREAWQKAIDIAPEGKVTAAIVSKVVKGMVERANPPAVIKTGEDSDAVFHLKRWWKKATKKDKKIFQLWIGA